MPTNNILLFDQNKGNMMGDTEYNTNQQRLNGVQSGIASSQLQNKFQYQVSLVAYAIASLMYNNGLDANDASAVSAFVSNLSSTLVQKVLDKASTAEARAGVVNTKWMSPALVKAAIDFTSVKLSGSTMTGPLILSGNPTANLGAATKQYVDNAVGGLIKIVYNGAVSNNVVTNFNADVSNAKILFFSIFSVYKAGVQFASFTLFDSTNKNILGFRFDSEYDSYVLTYTKTYNSKFAPSLSSASNGIWGGVSATFSTSFKVNYIDANTFYVTVYAVM